MVSSHLRFAAGVCVLAAGLLMGVRGRGRRCRSRFQRFRRARRRGTNVQASTTASKKPKQGGTAPRQHAGLGRAIRPAALHRRDENARPGTASQASAARRHRRDEHAGSGRQPGQRPSTGATSTMGSGARQHHGTRAGPAAATRARSSTLGSGAPPGQQPSTGATSPSTEAGGTDTEDPTADAGLVTAVPDVVAAVPGPSGGASYECGGAGSRSGGAGF